MNMAAKCANCGKGVMYGHNVSHAKNRTRKIFKPNLHWARITVDGKLLKVRVCTKCQRQLKHPVIRDRSKKQAPVVEVLPVIPVVTA